VARRPAAKAKLSAAWRITRITGKGALYIGEVEAPDAESAIKAALKKYDIAPQHRSRVAAQLIASA
jgi:hypothetical protein